MRSLSSSINRRGTIGSGLLWVDARKASVSVRPSVVLPRMRSSVSANPLVVMRPVVGPARVIKVLSATVQAWKKSPVKASSSFSPRKPRFLAASRTASRAPLEKSSGVESAFPRVTVPSLSSATQSVNVPPISTPTTYAIDEGAPFCNLPLFFEVSAGLVRFESPSIESLDSQVCFVGERIPAAINSIHFCAYGLDGSNQHLLVHKRKPAVSDDDLAVDQNGVPPSALPHNKPTGESHRSTGEGEYGGSRSPGLHDNLF